MSRGVVSSDIIQGSRLADVVASQFGWAGTRLRTDSGIAGVLLPMRGTGTFNAARACILADMGAKKSDRPPPSGLGFAVWSDDEGRVRSLLAEGASADDYGDGVVDKTPLMESVDEIEDFYDGSRAGVTRLLLDHQADVHRRDREGWTALHYAVGAGQAAVLLLLEAGADPNAAAADGATPLHEAVRRMNAGSVVTLCSFGAERSAVDHQGRTPAELLAHEDGNDEERALIMSAMS